MTPKTDRLVRWAKYPNFSLGLNFSAFAHPTVYENSHPHDTFSRVWARIEPSEFQECFQMWVSSIIKK